MGTAMSSSGLSSAPTWRRFEGMVALVTGSAWGMGLNHAQRFAAEGAKVVMCDILADKVKAAAAEIPGAIAVPCDVSNADDVARVIDAAMSQFGRIDILVNNAGGAIFPAKPIVDHTEDEFDTIVSINLKGGWLFAKGVFPSMRETGRGKIVNIMSSAALRPVPGRGIYGAAKGGLVSLTYTLAGEFGPFGINVNGVAPALTNIPHPKITYSDAEYEVMKAAALKNQPIKRVCEMDDMSDLVLFLCSSQSDMITGQIIPVTGGH
jgi:NAD(P)-dependent dehydrogenase (short-subunit alcohol dehydrogenase family)